MPLLAVAAVVLGIDLLRPRNLPSSGRGRRTWRRRRRDTKVGRNIYSSVRLLAKCVSLLCRYQSFPFLMRCRLGFVVVVAVAVASSVFATTTKKIAVVLVVDDDGATAAAATASDDPIIFFENKYRALC